jgi:hypothetical protein
MDKFYLNEPEMMQDLIDNGKIIKKKEKFVSDNRIIDAEYWIKTTVDDVYNYLLKKYPWRKNSEIEEFMRKKLKGKRGGSIGASFRVKKSVNQA